MIDTDTYLENIIKVMSAEIDWPRYQYLIFDLDGTLIDSSPGVIEATNYALIMLGEKPRRPEEIKRFIGYPLDKMFPAFCNAPVADLKAAFQEKARMTMVRTAVMLPGSAEIINWLHQQGYTLALATTKFTHHTEGLATKFGWSKFFAAIASGDEVARVKPAPDLIHLALERLQAKAEEAVMIGDTENDIIPAKQIGLKTIAIHSPFSDHDLSQYRPDLLLENVVQLKAVFARE